MGVLREVWVEFGDGSVAKYEAADAALQDLLDRLLSAGVARRVWVDGRAWPQSPGSEGADAERYPNG